MSDSHHYFPWNYHWRPPPTPPKVDDPIVSSLRTMNHMVVPSIKMSKFLLRCCKIALNLGLCTLERIHFSDMYTYFKKLFWVNLHFRMSLNMKGTITLQNRTEYKNQEFSCISLYNNFVLTDVKLHCQDRFHTSVASILHTVKLTHTLFTLIFSVCLGSENYRTSHPTGSTVVFIDLARYVVYS